MVVKINIYQGDEVTAEYIEIDKADKDKIKKAAKKYTKEFDDGYSGTFYDYLKSKKIKYIEFSCDLEISIWGDNMEYILHWQTVKDYRGNTEEHFEISGNKKYLESKKKNRKNLGRKLQCLDWRIQLRNLRRGVSGKWKRWVPID